MTGQNFCTACGAEVHAEHRFCGHCGAKLGSEEGTLSKITDARGPQEPEDWRSSIDYRVVLHAPEVKQYIAAATGQNASGMTAEQFIEGLLPIVNVSGAKLLPARFMMEIREKASGVLGTVTERTLSQHIEAPPGRTIAASACALASRGARIISGEQRLDDCFLVAETPSSAWNWKGEMTIGFSRGPTGTKVRITTSIPGRPLMMRGGETMIEDHFEELREYLSLQL